ncbi:MAG: dienelactone hydrolase family protein [Rhodoglobus sp.]
MTGMIQIAATTEDHGGFEGYRADPPEAIRGALIVIHEIWGLVDHIKGVADRFADEGYLVIAPDLLTGIGVDPVAGQELHKLASSNDEAERTAGQPLMREKLAPMRSPEYAEWAIGALKKVVDYLEQQPGVDGRIGVVGFCFGGTYSFALAAADDRIRAAVPFYGAPPATADAAAIGAPVLALYGSTDANLMASLPEVTERMAAAGVDFRSHTYEGAGHAFFNDTNSRTYQEAVAADAWQRALAFLAETLV